MQTFDDARACARLLGIAPAIVTGRIQRDREAWNFGQGQSGLFEKFEVVRAGEFD